MATVRLKLEYPLSKISEPIFTRLVTEFDVNPNVLAANIDAARGGWMILGLDGSDESIAQAQDWIRNKGIAVTQEAVA